MKKYIETKSVEAEMMDELTAVEKGFAHPNEDNHEWRQAWLIVGRRLSLMYSQRIGSW